MYLIKKEQYLRVLNAEQVQEDNSMSILKNIVYVN